MKENFSIKDRVFVKKIKKQNSSASSNIEKINILYQQKKEG